MIEIDQKLIKIKVDYYDSLERDLLLNNPNKAEIEDVVKAPIDVGKEEFLTYYLFYRKRLGKPGYSSYYDLGRNVNKALSDLEGWVTFNGTSICSAEDARPQDVHITERVGEAIGLSVINRIHGLTAADWNRIPQIGGSNAPKVFDYQIASDGNNTVQVETKGSCVNDNSLKTGTISNHKAGIKEKKSAIGNQEKANHYPFPADLRYGTIAVFDYRPGSIAHCWLIDPPGGGELSAKQVRLINRMRFLRDWISFVSPRSQLSAALSTRLVDLENLSDPFELDGIPLMKRTGETFDAGYSSMWKAGYATSFFANRPHVSDGPAGGGVVRLSGEELFFFGFMEDLVIMGMKQDFSKISSYKREGGVINKTVMCILTENQYHRLDLPERISRRTEKRGPFVKFSLTGDLYYSQEGLVFGALPIKE